MMRLKTTGNHFFFLAFLLGYHLLFTFLNWNYFAENGGDAAFYWFDIDASAQKSLTDLKYYGSDVLLLLNYPLAQYLNLDIRIGFMLYSLLGYLGILQYYRLCLSYSDRKPFVFKGLNLYFLLLLLPNLHFWTAGLGKEPLCFLFIATIILEFSKGNFKSVSLVLSVCLLILIRPHIALLLLFAIASVYFFSYRFNLKQRALVLLGTSVVSCGLIYMLLQLSEIKRVDFERIQRFNEFSLLSFKDSGSYVPMIEYSYPYKVFTFYFRPLVTEMPSLFGIVLGIENLAVLLLHLIAFIWFCINYKKIRLLSIHRIICIFILISALIVVQRYSAFGIFARTKVMMQPFMLCVLLWILSFRKKELKSE